MNQLKVVDETDTLCARLRAENPDKELHMIELNGETIVVHVPTPGEWQRFREVTTEQPNKRHSAMINLVGNSLVHPSRVEFDGMISRHPGLAESFGNEVCDIAGLSNKANRKKL